MIQRKIIDAINRLELNLTDRVVLTEAASGPYVVTPVIAAIAGAEVYAFTKSTRYGKSEEIKDATIGLFKSFDNSSGKLTVIEKLTPEIISRADIITNSGHLRPLSASWLKHARQGTAISLMYEAWEWREGEIDLDFCLERGFRVGATNERHPAVDVFNYLGDMALKLIYDAGLCPYKNKFVLLCNNDFGYFIAKVLSKVCHKLGVCDISSNKSKYSDLSIEWLGDFPAFSVSEEFKNAEAIIFSAYPFDKNWIGGLGTQFEVNQFLSEFESPYILRFAGDIDEKICQKQLNIYPQKVESGHMGILPSAIGFDPIIRLQAGGLKVGELMVNNEINFKGVNLLEYL